MRSGIPAAAGRKRGWIARPPTAALAWLAAAALACATGCGAGDEGGADEPATVTASWQIDSNIYGGVRDDGADDDAVVALRVGTGGTFELCTGALVAPNVVLTARHCVTKNATTSVSCDEEGRSANGQHVSTDEDPRTIGVYYGATPNFARRPDALARSIVAPKGTFLCDSDIALIVLDHPLEGVEPLAVRLEAPAAPGERIRSVGYGHNDQDVVIGTRFRKDDALVLAQGKTVSESRTPLAVHEFEVGKSICQGDSGGPAISVQTGAVIGVVSRGGGCDDDFGHIYTTTAGFDALFEEAFAVAGGTPRVESGALALSSRNVNVGETGSSAPSAASSCAIGTTSSAGGGGACALALAVVVLASRRRRS